MSESLPAYAAKERPWASWGARCAGLWWVQTEGSFTRSPSPSDSSISASFGDDESGSGEGVTPCLGVRARPAFPPLGPGFSSTSPQVRRPEKRPE